MTTLIHTTSDQMEAAPNSGGGPAAECNEPVGPTNLVSRSWLPGSDVAEDAATSNTGRHFRVMQFNILADGEPLLSYHTERDLICIQHTLKKFFKKAPLSYNLVIYSRSCSHILHQVSSTCSSVGTSRASDN